MNVFLGINAPWVGGIRIHVLTLAQALIAWGNRPLVVTDREILEEEMLRRNIPYKARVDDLPKMISLLLQWVRREKPQCLHAHSAAPLLDFFQISRLTGIPFMATIHGEYTAFFSRNELGRQIGRYISRVIAVSEQIKRYLIANSTIPAAKITVIPNGIDTAEYCPGHNSGLAREQLGIEPDEPVIMNFGRLEGDRQGTLMTMADAIILLAKEGVRVKGVFVGAGSLYSDLQMMNAAFRRETGRDVFILP